MWIKCECDYNFVFIPHEKLADSDSVIIPFKYQVNL